MNVQTEPTKLEEAAFPAEFLSCFAENAFQTLGEYLEKTHAPREAIELLDSAQVLLKECRWQEHGPKIPHSTNELLMDCVSDASRCIVALGGVFYAPSGTSTPRVDTEKERILDLICQGKGTPTIVNEVWSVTGGKRYQDLAEKVNALRAVAMPSCGDLKR